jgi:hypothetical protein
VPRSPIPGGIDYVNRVRCIHDTPKGVRSFQCREVGLNVPDGFVNSSPLPQRFDFGNDGVVVFTRLLKIVGNMQVVGHGEYKVAARPHQPNPATTFLQVTGDSIDLPFIPATLGPIHGTEI